MIRSLIFEVTRTSNSHLLVTPIVQFARIKRKKKLGMKPVRHRGLVTTTYDFIEILSLLYIIIIILSIQSLNQS